MCYETDKVLLTFFLVCMSTCTSLFLYVYALMASSSVYSASASASV